MARNLVIKSLILFILLCSLVLGVKAVTYQTGVSAGNTFYYDSSNNNSSTGNETTKLQITKVDSQTVYFTLTSYSSTGDGSHLGVATRT